MIQVRKNNLLTVITPRSTGYQWEKLLITAISPIGTKFLRVGFQSLAFNDYGGFWIDDIQVFD